jgi:hypothetical protein
MVATRRPCDVSPTAGDRSVRFRRKFVREALVNGRSPSEQQIIGLSSSAYLASRLMAARVPLGCRDSRDLDEGITPHGSVGQVLVSLLIGAGSGGATDGEPTSATLAPDILKAIAQVEASGSANRPSLAKHSLPDYPSSASSVARSLSGVAGKSRIRAPVAL